MGSTCGICAANSVLSYYGETESQYDMELTYLDIYERVTGKTVKGNGTTIYGLNSMVSTKGYTAKTSAFNKGSTPKFATYEAYVTYVRDHLKAGRPVVACTYMGSGHFITIIGYDDMGTPYIYDDVFIIADSSDYWDGYQDGYVVSSAYKFFRQHTNKGYAILQSFLVIYKKS